VRRGAQPARRKGAGARTSAGPAAGSDAQAILDAFRAIVQRLRISSRACERQLGLSSAQLFVLEQLAQADASSIADLARRTLTHQSSVSVVVTRLAERGLVARRTAAGDARRTEIALTPAGRALLGRAPRTVQADLVAAIDGMPPGERRALAQRLTALARAAGAGADVPPLFFEDAQPNLEDAQPNLEDAQPGPEDP
jgi:DNA-binding MarR family transcriptional regulator